MEAESSEIMDTEKMEKKKQATKIDFSTSDKATKRVIAPFVKIFRKKRKAKAIEEEEDVDAPKYVFPYKRPSVLIHHMSGFLSENLDLSSLLHDTANVLKNAVRAKGVLLYLIEDDEIYLSHKSYQNERLKQKWKIGPGSIAAAYVAFTKRVTIVDDILTDMRFDNSSQSRDETMKSVLCVPIVTPDEECFSVLELFRDIEQPVFDAQDINTVLVTTGWIGAAVQQNQMRLLLQKKMELHQFFLKLIMWFSESALPEMNVIQEILSFVKHTLGAEKGILYKFVKFGTETCSYLYEETPDHKLTKKVLSLKYFEEAGLVNNIIQSRKIYNITDPNDPIFKKFSEQKVGSINRAMLCLPIISYGEVIAIFMLLNKVGWDHFTKADEKLAELLGTYTAMAMKHSEVVLSGIKADYEKEDVSDLINYHIKACEHDRKHYLEKMEGVILPNNFREFSWYIELDDFDNIPRYALYMIERVCGDFDVNSEQMMDFILSLRKNYRKNPYHNFEHAFNVCHCVYNVLRRNMLDFKPIERKALIIAALSHDVDSLALTNNFLVLTDHLWSKLYTTSPSESHHSQIALRMLKNFNIFYGMDSDSYELFTKQVKENIISTDVFVFFNVKLKLEVICEHELYQAENDVHRSYLRSMLMTAGDLSMYCKSFHVCKRLVDLLLSEYYHQGDLEREMGFIPLALYDRYQSHKVSVEQVKFLKFVGLPCFNLLKIILPNTSALYDSCMVLLKQWEEIDEYKNQKTWKQDESIFCNKGSDVGES
ncbi:cAMP and cAMP-inhibited cGMP 3',5'-cyclic phosphodiesterase 10A-like [Agrilus planipennis]|uniref:3',5'-cyclic-GMP phosphodiesterase n=1 Tax=Agrilus planipennis TaxID=224129 RepID=A0A1W4WWH4_AGRPL|nr:cAMP and cAMP-inhibited cGMP 3',5'-cyclic phosphodiesterase 10A-like [Agrilus planipennis]